MLNKTVTELVDEIQKRVNRGMADARKSDRGNRQAGIRLRKTLLDIKGIATLARAKVIKQRDKS